MDLGIFHLLSDIYEKDLELFDGPTESTSEESNTNSVKAATNVFVVPSTYPVSN